MGASQGYLAKLAFDDSTFDASSEPYQFVSETFGKTGTLLETPGIRGSRSRFTGNVRTGPYTVAGQIVMHPNVIELSKILPRILGAAPSSTTYALGDTYTAFNVMIDRVGKVFTYGTCYISKATFRSGPGRPLEMVLDILGTTETVGNAGTFPAVTWPDTATVNDMPFIFEEGVLTLVATPYAMLDMELVIDNMMEARFANALTANAITPKDRLITLKTTNPFTTTEAGLYDVGGTAIAGSLAFTNGSVSLSFAFTQLQYPSKSPLVSGKQEIPLELEFTVRTNAVASKEMVVTLDSTE